jgi:xanthosine utilization system XapX-like protein
MNQFNWASMEMFPVSARASLEPPVILDVLDTANLPSSPSKPNRPVIALVGGILGIILGALISVVRRLSMPPAIAPLHTVNG